MRESGISAAAVTLLPAILPLLAAHAIGVRQPLVWVAILIWALIAVAWGCVHYWRIFKEEISAIDRKYEEETRFLLSKEYHPAESDGTDLHD